MPDEIPFVDRRRATRRPHVVYLFWRDDDLLDIYHLPSLAFAAAERYMADHGGEWVAARPGRWYGPGHMTLTVEDREVSDRVAGEIAERIA